jgi:UDP-glucose 4-epimerase
MTRTVHLITGGAGFIGSNLVGRLLDMGDGVVAIDNLCRGRAEFVAKYSAHPNFRFFELDSSDVAALRSVLTPDRLPGPITEVWHMAANSDIPAGVADPGIDLRDTFLTTFAILGFMKEAGVPVIRFASSSAIYGDFKDTPIHENLGPLEPISNYGAMKLASEGQIRAAVEAYLQRADIFRFPNVVGVPATHGIIIDLVRKCLQNPKGFEVLGDGTQQKVYLHCDDLLNAMLFIRANATGRYNVFNIASGDDGITVREIAEAVRDRTNPASEIYYGKGNKGWVGDVPRFRYQIGRLAQLGFEPSMGSAQAVRKAVDEIVRQETSK